MSVPSSRWMFSASGPSSASTSSIDSTSFAPSLNQRVATARHAAIDRPRHGEHLAALLVRVPGRDQRAGAVGRFDDDRAQRQPADDAIALRKRAAERHHPRRRFADQVAVRRNFVGQLLVLGRIDFQQAAGQHGDRPPAGRQRAAMGGRIDAARQAAHDREARPRQAAGQPLGLREPVARGMPRADDRHRHLILRQRLCRGETARPADRESARSGRG